MGCAIGKHCVATSRTAEAFRLEACSQNGYRDWTRRQVAARAIFSAHMSDDATKGSAALQTITADKLRELTGLTDQRHRQLAKEGWFPPPIESAYQLEATVSGLFRYYREANRRTKEKSADLKDEKTKKENHLLNLKIAREEGRSIPREAVDTAVLDLAVRQRSELYRILVNELPSQIVGQDIATVRQALQAAADNVCALMRGLKRAINEAVEGQLQREETASDDTRAA